MVPRGQESNATRVQDKPTRVEFRCGAFVKGPRSHSPPSLRITPVKSDSVRSVEAPTTKETEGIPPADIGNAAPTTLRIDKVKIPEPKPACTSTKRDKVDSVSRTWRAPEELLRLVCQALK